MELLKIYKRVYDNPLNPDGTEKENTLLGIFEVPEHAMDDYDYEFYARNNEDGEIYKITGREVSFANGGVAHSIIKLSETEDVKEYLKHHPENK